MTSGTGRDRDRGTGAVGGAAAGRGGGGGGVGSTATVDGGGGGGERSHEDVMAVVEQVSGGSGTQGKGEGEVYARCLVVYGPETMSPFVLGQRLSSAAP